MPPAPPVTIFERVSRLAVQAGAINLGQGFPDLPDPPELIDAARRALAERSSQYPPMRGLPELRAAVAGYYAREQGLEVDPDEVVITSGATEALAAAILALVRPGDEVVLVQPLYDAYVPLVKRAGGVVRLIDLAPPHWRLPLDQLRETVSDRTRLILLNTPNNPTGTALGEAELQSVATLCERHDVLLLCDEVWEAMILDGARHISPLSFPALRSRSIKIGSAGKIFSLTGWKVGWAVAARPLADAIAAQHQFLTFTTPPALQWAVAEGLALPALWHADHRARYAAAKAQLVSGLQDAGFVVLPANSTWFVTIDLAASGLPIDDEPLVEAMIAEAGVAAIPVSAFYAETPRQGLLRLCFAKRSDTLAEAVVRLKRFRESHGQRPV